MSTDERASGRGSAPLYARLLRLRRLRISGLTSFLLVECSIAAAVLLALAEFVSWWAVPLLPVLVATMVKINDMVGGPSRGDSGDGAGAGTVAGSHPVDDGQYPGRRELAYATGAGRMRADGRSSGPPSFQGATPAMDTEAAWLAAASTQPIPRTAPDVFVGAGERPRQRRPEAPGGWAATNRAATDWAATDRGSTTSWDAATDRGAAPDGPFDVDRGSGRHAAFAGTQRTRPGGVNGGHRAGSQAERAAAGTSPTFPPAAGAAAGAGAGAAPVGARAGAGAAGSGTAGTTGVAGPDTEGAGVAGADARVTESGTIPAGLPGSQAPRRVQVIGAAVRRSMAAQAQFGGTGNAVFGARADGSASARADSGNAVFGARADGSASVRADSGNGNAGRAGTSGRHARVDGDSGAHAASLNERGFGRSA